MTRTSLHRTGSPPPRQFKRREDCRHGGIDPDVNLAPFSYDLIGDGKNIVCLSDIESEYESPASRGFDVAPRAFKPFGATGNQSNVKSVLRKGNSGRAAHARRGPGNDHDRRTGYGLASHSILQIVMSNKALSRLFRRNLGAGSNSG